MASRAKIRVAHDESGKSVWAWTLNGAVETRRRYHCPHCSADLSWVKAFEREGVRVHSHFRLHPGQGHSAECPLALGSVADAIRKRAPWGLSNYGDGRAGRVLVKIPEIPSIQKRKKEWPQFESNLKEVISITLDLSSFDEEVDEHVAFGFEDRIIAWDRWYFDFERYPKLLASCALVEEGLYKSLHPVAIRGTVTGSSPSSSKSSVRVTAAADFVDGESWRPAFVMFSRYADMYPVGTEFIAVTRVAIRKTHSERWGATSWINLLVESLRQIHVLPKSEKFS